MASSIQIDVSANIAKFKTAMDKAAKEGSNLNSKLNKSFGAVNKAMKAVGTLAGVAVAGGLTTIAKKSIDSADKIQKLSQRLGASSEALSEYRHVAELSGVSFETLTMGWQRMTRRVAEAANGTGEARNALKELGISAVDLNKLAPEKQFEALTDAIMGVKNPADQVRLAMKLFDSEGVSLIQTMQGGSEGIKAMRAEAVELGLSLSQDQVNAAAAANDALSKLTSSISGSFSQSILNYADEIAVAADITREYLPKAIGVLVDAFKGLQAIVQLVVLNILDKFQALFEAAQKIPLVGDKFKGAADFFAEASDVIDVQLKDNISSMGKWRDSAKKSEKQTQDSTKKAFDFGVQTDKNTKTTEANKEAIKKSTAAYNGFMGGVQSALDKMRELTSVYGKFGGAAEEVDSIIFSNEKSTARLSGIKVELRRRLDAGIITLIQYQSALESAGVSTDSLKAATEKSAGVMRESWERFRDSAFSSLETFYRDGLSGAKSFGDSIKDTFKDIVSSILAQITALIASNIFQKFLGYVSGNKYGNSNTGVFDGLGALFAGSGGSNSNSASQAGAIFGESAGNAFSGAAGIYGGYNQIDAGLEEGGTSGALNVISGAASIYKGGTELYGFIQGFNSASSTLGSTLAQTQSIANTFSSANAFASGNASALNLTTTSTVAPTAAPVSNTGAAATTGGASAGVAATAGWIAAGVIADQYLNDGRVTKAFAGEFEERKQGWKDLFDGDYSSFIKSQWQAGINAVVNTFRGRTPEEIFADEIKGFGDDAFEAINILGAGVSIEAGTNGKAGAGGYISGASVNALGEFLKESGYEIFEGNGIIRALKAGSTQQEFNDLINTFQQTQVEAARAISRTFEAVEKSSIKSMGSSFRHMDELFDSTADGAMSVRDRMISAYETAFEVTTEAAGTWYDTNEGLAAKMGEVFNTLSGDSIDAFTGFFDNANAGFEDIMLSARNTASGIVSEFDSTRANLAGSFEGLQLGQIAPISVDVSANQGQLDQLIEELRQTNQSNQQVSAQLQNNARNQELESINA